ncbi:MAG TPA: hypothetical protein VFA85_18640 [Terriglobales bacterium]|nr:hypothetical protein [Terriglobales bacterium]
MSIEIPIIFAERDESGTVRFWCKYCKRYHIHGCFGLTTSHCTRVESPNYDGQYELVETIKLEFERPE